MNRKILLLGGAGLVGQNLVFRLKVKGYKNIVVLDKHRANLEILKKIQPDITALYADLAEPGEWQYQFHDADVVVMLQAQIGGNEYQEFVRNNIDSTRLILGAIKQNNVPCTVHISSSVLDSVADDFYTNTKRAAGEYGIGQLHPVSGAATDADVRLVRPQAFGMVVAFHEEGTERSLFPATGATCASHFMWGISAISSSVASKIPFRAECTTSADTRG